MKRRSRHLKIFLYTAFICIGAIIGLVVSQYIKLPSTDTINIIDLATLVTTIFLAVYIPEVLDRKLQITRDKKELLEKRIMEIQALYRKANLLVQSDDSTSKNDLLTIKNSLDVAKGKLDIFTRLLSYSKLGASFDNDLRKIKALDKEHREILLQNPEQISDTSGSDKESHNGETFRYKEQIRISEEVLYNKLDEVTSLLIFKISDS